MSESCCAPELMPGDSFIYFAFEVCAPEQFDEILLHDFSYCLLRIDYKD